MLNRGHFVNLLRHLSNNHFRKSTYFVKFEEENEVDEVDDLSIVNRNRITVFVAYLTGSIYEKGDCMEK